MTNRRVSALLAALMIIGLAGEAFALDGYRDRRGIFYGLGIGGGANQFDTDGADNQLGFHIRGRVGGGINERVTLDGELGYRTESEESDGLSGELTVSRDFLSLYMGANFFVFDGLYLRAMGGLNQLVVTATLDGPVGSTSDDDSTTGLGLGGGIGYEFFASADLAIGIGFDFQYLMYDDFTANQMNFGAQFNWY